MGSRRGACTVSAGIHSCSAPAHTFTLPALGSLHRMRGNALRRLTAGGYWEAWFACSKKTGEHHILKKYFKGARLASMAAWLCTGGPSAKV